MQFIDLSAQQKRIRERIETNIKKVLDHGRYINGPEIKELEEKLAGYVGVKYAAGVSSGTDALLIVLKALGIGPGDAVLTSTFTFIATAEVIQLLGATPVFVDIDRCTFNMDVTGLENTITGVLKEGKLRPKAVIPVDLFGQPADYEEINKIADKHNLIVLEDAAQSFGASYKGRKACSLAAVGTTSFFPAKPLGCYGDGGMIFTDRRLLFETILSLRNHGQGRDKYDNVRVGFNGRLDTIQAAILLAKYEILDEEIAHRQEVAKRYNEGLKNIVEIPFIKGDAISAWAQYSVMHSMRDTIIQKINSDGIPTAVYYPKPLHLQGAFSTFGYQTGDFPVAERVSKEIFSLPMHPYLEVKDQERIVESVKSAL